MTAAYFFLFIIVAMAIIMENSEKEEGIQSKYFS